MAHISLPEGIPGIGGPLTQYPEIAVHFRGLAQTLMRGPSSLSLAERELIGTYVSSLNHCWFCTNSHRAATRHLLMADDQSPELVDQVCQNLETAPVSGKMRSLLRIAQKVQQGGRSVTDEDVALARQQGADDKAIHDAVLIAAAFSMFNRYVDGLATWAPEDVEAYDAGGARLAQHGYVLPTSPAPVSAAQSEPEQ